MKYYIGIDLGGTNIKAGVVDQDGNILATGDRPTCLPRSPEAVAEDIIVAMDEAIQNAGLLREEIGGIGFGCPGVIDPQTGMVEYSNNLNWSKFPLGEYLRQKTGLPVCAGNDANVAAYGEVCAGSAKGAQSAVIITLGTGVGSGVVSNGKVLTGYNGAASEFGHMVVEKGGVPCTCGRHGCLESYASATGLIRMTREAIEAYPESGLYSIAKAHGKIDGKTAFIAMRDGDTVAAEVVDKYISYLACGLTNIINALQPEVISLGGGIAKEGEALLVPLREKTYAELFGGCGEKHTKITTCTLGYRAGIIGAAMLSAN